jgi:hypothetical protein
MCWASVVSRLSFGATIGLPLSTTLPTTPSPMVNGG